MKKTYFTIVQDFDAKDYELRQFRQIVQSNELLTDFHSFVPSMGVSSKLIQSPLDYGFIICERILDDRRQHNLGRFDFKRLETALEFSFKSNVSLYDGINSRLVKSRKLSLKKSLYSVAFMSESKQKKHQHYLETIAKLQEIGASKPEFFDFHKHVKVEFTDRSD